MLNRIRAAVVVMGLVLAVGSAGGVEPPAEMPPGHTAPDGAGRIQRVEATLDVTPEEFWALLSSPEGIKKLWSVARAEVDLRPGGTIRAAYEADESTGWITHHILAVEPARMLAFRTDAPPKAPESVQLICRTGWTVIRLEPDGPGRTRMTESMMGFGTGPLYDEAYAFFEKGNTWTAEQMQRKLRAAEARADEDQRAWSLLERLAGGEWIHEGRSERGVFRIRNVIRPGPGGRSLAMSGWLGGEGGMVPHASGLVWREPTGEVRYANLDERGGRASGRVTSPEENAIDWDWAVLSEKGESSRYAVRFTFEGEHAYRGQIWSVGPGGERTSVVDAVYRRVPAAPAMFCAVRGEDGGNAVHHDLTIDGGQFAATGEIEPGVVKEAVFDCAPEAAFRMFATSEGWKSAFGVESVIELRVGGPYEIYFSPEPPPGERGAEGCRVLSYLPGRMLSFSWNAPPKFAAERARRTWVVLTFAPAEGGKTAVRLEHAGFGSGGEWPEVRAYFDQAWGRVLEGFRSRASASAIR